MMPSKIQRLRAAGLAVAMTISAAAIADDASARASSSTPGAPLLHVATDGGRATCRVYNAAGAPLTGEFGAPATVAVSRRMSGDQVVCFAADGESRVTLDAGAQSVTMASRTGRAAMTHRRSGAAADIHPDRGRIKLSAQAERDLVWLRERFEAGQIEERTYFQRRREVINRDRDALQSVAAVSRAPRRAR
jgi:hypothetical protein